MLREGELIEGKYRIVRPIGKGGMGVVYLGAHSRIRRQVAIKVLNKDVADLDAVRRFEKEAQAAGAIGSDHIVEVLDLGVLPTGESFMVMEYLEGETLRRRLKERPLSAQGAALLFDQLLEGLAAAHAAGIVHRDLKPDNVFLVREKAGRKDFVKILDFGISKFAASGDEHSLQTRTGTVMGTPVYMSPEQVKSSHDVDARSDVYSAGVILFQAVTGRLPFSAPAFHELLFKIVYEPPIRPADAAPHLDPGFCAIVSKAMDRDPAARYPSARAFQTALALWRADTAAANPRASSADLQPADRAAPAPGLAAFLDSARSSVEPPPSQPSAEYAATELLSSTGSQVAAAPQSISTAAATSSATVGGGAILETQKSWSPGSLDAAPPRRSQLALIAGGALLTLAVGAGLLLRSADPPSAAAGPDSTTGLAVPAEMAGSPAHPTPAAAADVPSAEPATAPVASASASASATAAVSAKPARAAPRPRGATPATPKPGESESKPRPAGTVSDFGY